MTRTAADVLPFRPRQPASSAPVTDLELVRRLLDLAHEVDRAGRLHAAGLLVGAAYAMCDDPLPCGGGRRRTA